MEIKKDMELYLSEVKDAVRNNRYRLDRNSKHLYENYYRDCIDRILNGNAIVRLFYASSQK